MWSGLGYNNRARRLYESSKILAENGFDKIYPDFETLPGVGQYTKNALLSFEILSELWRKLLQHSREWVVDNDYNPSSPPTSNSWSQPSTDSPLHPSTEGEPPPLTPPSGILSTPLDPQLFQSSGSARIICGKTNHHEIKL